MAIQVKSIQSGGGGDYTTIAAWEAAAPTLGTDIWKGEIDDNSNYNENVTMSAAGTASSTSYLWLTGGASNRHSGVAGTGHPRVYATVGGNCFTVSTSFTRIEWLDIKQDQNGGSDEGIRVNTGADDVLISHCIIWTDSGGSDQDGIYTGDWPVANLRIDNCVMYGWRRAGIHLQQFGTGTARTITADLDHCSIYDCGDTAEAEGGAVHVRSSHASDSITVGIYNTWGMATRNSIADFRASDSAGIDPPAGTVTWNGSHNCENGVTDSRDLDGTNNTTNWQTASNGVVDTTQSSGSYVVITETAVGTEDLTLLDTAAGNLPAGNGTNRQGSEPDSRQDFSVTVTGATRPTSTVDIGADQVSTGEDPANLQASVTTDDVTLTWTASP